MTETNAKPIEPTCSMCPSYPRIQAELSRLTAELKDREGEVEKLTHERDLWENMAAMRLTDQEAIERHVTKRVAGECAEIAETFRTPYGSHPLLSGVQIGAVIRNKYGVE